MILSSADVFFPKKEEGITIRIRYNQEAHLTRDTIWESDKNKTHKRAKRSALSQQTMTRLQETDKRYKDIHET